MTEVSKAKAGNGAAHAPESVAIAEDIAVLQEAFGRLVEHVKIGTFETATGQARRLAARADQSTKMISQQIEERPLTALLIAFGVGLVGGRLLSR